MKVWPFNRKTEKRAVSLTEAQINYLLTQSGGTTGVADVQGIAALEACAGMVGRAMAVATVGGRGSVAEAVTTPMLVLVGRQLLRRGEQVFRVVVDPVEGLTLHPASDWDVTGGYDRRRWRYQLTFSGPSTTTTVSGVPAAEVLHFQYSTKPTTPWIGEGPLQVAYEAGRLGSEVVRSLADEARSPHGSFLPLPKEDDTTDALKADIKTARGEILTVEGGDWDIPQTGSGGTGNTAAWKTQRFGMQPPESAIMLHGKATDEVCAACGLPWILWASTGADSREAWRQALHAVIGPLGRIIETELRRVLDADVRLAFDELRASDLQARARAFSQMIGRDAANPNIPVDEARRIAGLA